jgi:hypothetical protein
MGKYQNIESIERDLKILDLERKIALEEIKGLKHDYLKDLKPLNWVQSGLKLTGKLASMLILKKILK